MEVNKRRIGINLVFSLVALVLNLLISFFITPYITNSLGADAYGFVKLANDFASYASLTSITLNSMASRFIMIEREKHHNENANIFYSSITIANIILAGILLVPSVLCVAYLEKIINVPVAMMLEVKLTFAITFMNFLINLVFSTFSNCYYLTNRLDINSVCDMRANLLRTFTMLILFLLLSPRISYMAIGTFVATVYLISVHVHNHHRLTPDLVFKLKDFRWAAVWKVISSGIWNSITKLSQIFSSGLDLLVTNVLIGSVGMGYLSVAKTIPSVIATLNSTVANVFSPDMMKLYALNDLEHLKKTVQSAMRFMSVYVTVPTVILITMGSSFYELWVPGQPSMLINVLAVLTAINSVITGPMQPLYQIFTITNKVRNSSIVLMIYGFISVLITYICLKTTNLGLYAVAGVSLIGSLVVALCYHLPFSAIYIGLPWNTFFPIIGKSIITLMTGTVIAVALRIILPSSNTWLLWFSEAILISMIILISNCYLVLNKEERNTMKDTLRRKLCRR